VARFGKVKARDLDLAPHSIPRRSPPKNSLPAQGASAI